MSKKKIGVLIAEDSEGLLQLLVKTMERDAQLEVRGVARNGEEAVSQTLRLSPDVITMDLNMPKVDGVEAIRQIMASKPTPIIVVTSAADGEKSFNAIRAGALDVIAKPQAVHTPEGAKGLAFIVEMVKLMSDVKVLSRRSFNPASTTPALEATPTLEEMPTIFNSRLRADSFIPGVVTIASSTGGPPALSQIIKDLPATFPVPILLVQHITAGFGDGLVEWLNNSTALTVRGARDGEIPMPGTVYFAPDNLHLMIDQFGKTRLSRALPIKGHRPSANLLFESAGQFYGASSLGIILTGMGDDGVQGLMALKKQGGLCIAQNERSCVVFGMPKAAIDAGLADAVMSLTDIAGYLQNIITRVERLKRPSLIR